LDDQQKNSWQMKEKNLILRALRAAKMAEEKLISTSTLKNAYFRR